MSKITQFFDAGTFGVIDQIDTNFGGPVFPVAGVVNIFGGRNIKTTGSGNTVTIDLDALIDGQLFIGNTGNPATAATLTPGPGIAITNGAGSITITATGAGFTWTEVTNASANLAVENGYVANRGTLVTLTLPATAVLGDTIKVIGKGTGLYKIAQNASQFINFVSVTTTVGVGGSLTATEQFDAIELVCTTTDNGWTVASSTGNFTVA
jgi:hypothetical protein